MKVNQRRSKQKAIFEVLPQAINAFKKNIIDPFFGDYRTSRNEGGKPPLRAELFTLEQLKQHALALAKRHALISHLPAEQLLKRLAENERILLEVHALLTETVKNNIRIVPAAEWLLDNFYLIEEQVYTGKKHLPKGYSIGLPQLEKGASAGLPRIYDMAVEIISHSDGLVNLLSLTGFIESYQLIKPLQLGELWALPIMLRLALLENLRRLAIQISIDISNKSLAAEWADKMMAAAENDPKNLVLVIADMARSEPPLNSSFIAELTRRLQEKGNALSLALNWIEQRLTEDGFSSTVLIQLENQKQAADQVSISNSISGLRFLSTTHWQDFVETTSIVEKILRQDLEYGRMDFHTRDLYRHSVEKIAKHSNYTELQIAEMAIDAAKKNITVYQDPASCHIGYFLIGNGLAWFEKRVAMRFSIREKCITLAKKAHLFLYAAGIILITVGCTSAGAVIGYKEGLRSGWLAGLITSLLMVTGQFAMGIINWFVTILVKPVLLPRIDFSKGIADDCRTMVVIPTLITNSASISNLVEGLEVRFLANRDANLCFALLTDFKDAEEEKLSEDEPLLLFARNKIEALNKKYERPTNDTFFLFHRPRRWNPKDKIWMGYERKRGKLAELNDLVQGKGKESFSLILADEHVYTTVKYIITLDTDTELPRDAAWKMVGTMAHALNRPYYDEKKQRVTGGYTILQPRVSNSLPVAGSSLYALMHGNEPGTDPYTKATSDVYQDLFREGSFIGKGIYDIKAFELSLKNRLPENQVLSHDLLEGAYARAGLITDVQLYEEYPSEYIADIQRRERWIRGDWQIISWITPFTPGADKQYHKNPLSFLSKWKIADNLRRSIVPLAFLLLLLYGWIISLNPVSWTIAVLGIIFLPDIIHFVWQLFWKPKDVVFIQHLFYTGRSFKDTILQKLTGLSCLPYEAFVYTCAIFITLWRMLISHRNLLRWQASHIYQKNQEHIIEFYKRMWFAPFIALLIFGFLIIYYPFSLVSALPFLIAWFSSPFVAWYISQPVTMQKMELSEVQLAYLRKLARKIWLFFETFITAEDNWLPPDNYQEHPVEKTAHRTSPTNIGLSLLASLTACDFGYITITEFLERTDNTLNTLLKMEKYRGHLFNWYDTTTLAPLHPRYISTVDSGNLAGHLLSLKQGLLELPQKKIIPDSLFLGLIDSLAILEEKIQGNPLLKNFAEGISMDAFSSLQNLPELKAYINSISSKYKEIAAVLNLEPGTESALWAEKIATQILNIENDINIFLPWLASAEIPAKFKDLAPSLPAVPTLKQLARIEETLLQKIVGCYYPDNDASENNWLNKFRNDITESARRAKEILLWIDQLAARCTGLANIEYAFLYDNSQHLFTIGYNVDEHRKDNGYYDLLASEARLTTFVAIAQGKIPQQGWFALGRQLTHHGTAPLLLSWSGSMFEYLMPLLVMPGYKNTLLDQTVKGVIQKQVEYGRKRNVPWGISESGYNLVDANLNYQYRAFGVPGLGFKRGLGEDLVIAPYATIMALMVSPGEAYHNLLLLKEEGFEGKYGFYEAIDYTASRLQRKQTHAVVRSFMAHHQGMSLLSISYLLLNQPMQQRFEADVEVKSALLLLQERIPRITTFYSPAVHEADISITPGGDNAMRVINTPHTSIPEVQLLSNGRYHVMLTNAGGGYSRWKNIAVTRWREDCTCDNWGTFCFINDLDRNVAWSAAFQPLLKEGDGYEAVFSQGRAEFRRRDLSLETHTEIIVSPEDDIELRRLHITNHSRKKRSLEITSYAEVVLAVPGADEAHPAFSNLFIETKINERRHAILCTRRPRSAEEQNPWMFHLMKVQEAEIIQVSYETDRSKFIGRGNSIHNPEAIMQPGQLSGSNGSVLDPIVSIQYRIALEPYQTAIVDMIFGIAETNETCNNLIDKYQDSNIANRGIELAWTHSQVILRQINATEAEAQLYNKIAASIIFSNASMRTDPAIIIKNQRGQSGLWSYTISGDLPIVLLQIEDASNIDLVKQMVQAHAYWRLKGLVVDLVIWNEDHGGYRQELHDRINSLVAPDVSANLKDQPGGIFIRSADQISNEDRILFQTVAHIVLSDRLGTLEEQVNRSNKTKTVIPYLNPTKFYTSLDAKVALPLNPPEAIQFFNGTGGFSKDGREYIIYTNHLQKTPAPWINVLGNPHFGAVISESGQSYTWVENAHEMRLTPWNNDPVSDLNGEALYIRDEESVKFWSASPLPCGGSPAYLTRHGFGYSVFEHTEDGIYSSMKIFIDTEAPVKFIVLKIHNSSGRHRRLSATGYVEWVLGDLRSKNIMHTITEMDKSTGAILARNNYNPEFEKRVAFFASEDINRTFTTDRTEFIGRNGTYKNPDGMNRVRLSGKTGAALDPCAAIQVSFELEEEEEREIIFLLGAGRNTQDALSFIQTFGGTTAAQDALQRVHKFWKETLGAIQIETPDAATNILTNGWLTYQALACRIWARSGFYQSGGAFGFRDQLQDVLSLIHIKPALVKEQLLLCASRQFNEGDVQHWWHPPKGRGVRTTCSDDYLWLPFVTAKYVMATGDKAILDEAVNFLEGRLLNAGEESYYDLPVNSDRKESMYDHCVKAIEHGLKFGENGLPLMGSGDWNDGMDKVGNQGKGESVWLAFFLYDILMRFTDMAVIKNDKEFAGKCRQAAKTLRKNIDTNAWDGEWYRRAYFDDGTPLGSVRNDECKIDSIAQSWSVLSKAGEPERTGIAMESAYKYLVKEKDSIIQLFDPPFNKSTLNPGYIKGYVPGVRENGGQYTHSAIWLVMAFAALGDRKRTWELLKMINPLNHAGDAAKIATYKVEPYVMAADVYAESMHKGRGGWTWYTGSAGWMYQLIIESVIGLRKQGNQLSFKPCFSPEWQSVKVNYQFEDTLYQIQLIQVQNPEDAKIIVDNIKMSEDVLVLFNDRVTHQVKFYVQNVQPLLLFSVDKEL